VGESIVTQCAAVSTSVGAMTVPPQTCVYRIGVRDRAERPASSWTLTTDEYVDSRVACETLVPPTMRPSAAEAAGAPAAIETSMVSAIVQPSRIIMPGIMTRCANPQTAYRIPKQHADQ
jgi:hypothetical protein